MQNCHNFMSFPGMEPFFKSTTNSLGSFGRALYYFLPLAYIKGQREKIGTKGKFQIGGIDNSSLPLMPHNVLGQYLTNF